MDRDREIPRRLGRRPVLDGLRGIAILLVVLSHTGLLPNGYIGVDLFFALSGFLITSLLLEECERQGRISLRRFYARRARRLLPALGLLLVLALIVNLACYRLTGWPFMVKAASTTLFVNNWLAATGHARDLGSLSPTWSLAQEEQFYAVWPLALLLLLRAQVRPPVIAALLLASAAALISLAPTGTPHGYAIYYSPAARAAEPLLGCLTAVIWRHRLMPALGNPRWPRRVRAALAIGGHWRSVVLAAATGLFVFLLRYHGLPVAQVYLGACLLGVVLIPSLLESPVSLVTRVIGSAPLRFLGRISYALYLVHLLVRNVVYHYLPGGSPYLNALLTITVSVGLATASWELVESRVLGRGRAAVNRPGKVRSSRAQLMPART